MRPVATLSIKFAELEKAKDFFGSHFPQAKEIPPTRVVRAKKTTAAKPQKRRS
jgi:hypothetical protein